MNQTKVKPAAWFWVIAVIALIWNAMGVFNFIIQVFASPEMLQSMPEEQRMMVESRPIWATVAFAVAVWGGFIAAILLLLRKAAAIRFFVISLIGIVVQMTYELFVAELSMAVDAGMVVITILIPLLGIIFILVSRSARTKGWIA